MSTISPQTNPLKCTNSKTAMGPSFPQSIKLSQDRFQGGVRGCKSGFVLHILHLDNAGPLEGWRVVMRTQSKRTCMSSRTEAPLKCTKLITKQSCYAQSIKLSQERFSQVGVKGVQISTRVLHSYTSPPTHTGH